MAFFSSLPAGFLAFVLADGGVDSNLPFNILKIYFMKKNIKIRTNISLNLINKKNNPHLTTKVIPQL